MTIEILRSGRLPLAVWTIYLILFMVSCKKDNELASLLPTQLFRPVQFIADVNGNNITFSWVPIKGASYALEVKRVGNVTDAPLVFAVDSAYTFQVGNLYSESDYSARIKAVSKDPAIKDSEYQDVVFTTGTENIFYEVKGTNIGAGQVLLQWDKSKGVSAIIASTEGSPDRQIMLSQGERSNGEKLVEGLQADTNYIFRIYLGDMLRGTVSVKTP